MSMLLNSDSVPCARRRPDPWYASALARLVRKRRRDLGMTVADAAKICGIELSQWAAIEDGFVPSDEPTLRWIAETLEADAKAVSFIALLARLNQPLAD